MFFSFLVDLTVMLCQGKHREIMYNRGPAYGQLQFDSETRSKFGFIDEDNRAQYTNNPGDLARYFPVSTSSSSSSSSSGYYQGLFGPHYVMSQPYPASLRSDEQDSRSTTLRSTLYRSSVGQSRESLPLSGPSYFGLTSSTSSTDTPHHPQLAEWTNSLTSPYGRPRPAVVPAAALDVRASTSSIDYWRPTTFGDGTATSIEHGSATTSGNDLQGTVFLAHISSGKTL